MSGSRNAQNGNEDVVMPDSDDIYTQAATSSRNTTTNNNNNSNASIRDVEMIDDTNSTSSRRRKSSTVDDDLYYHPSARNRNANEEEDQDEDEDEDDDEEHDLNILSRNGARRFRNPYQDESDDNEDDEDDDDDDDDEDEDEDEDEEDEDDDDDGYEDDNAAGRRSLRTAESLMAQFRDLDSLSQAVMGITTRVNPLIEAITQRDDPMTVLIGLQEFAELILMSHEEIILEALPFSKVLDALSDVLVNPLFEDNVEISLMGCRCVSNLVDAAPSSLDKFSYSSVVTSLCHKLFEVQYIDIVEIALTAGGLAGCLTYLDFFSIPTQRIATEIVANSCASISIKHFSLIQDIIPMFETIINSHDSDILKNITNSICGIVENFIGHPKKVQELITPTLSKKLLSFLNPNLTTGANVTPRIIKTLGIIIKLSPEHTHLALKEKIADNLYQVLTKHASTFDDGDGDATMLEKDNTSIVHALIYAPKDIMSSSLSIFSHVLPDVSVDEGCEFTGPFKLKYTTDAQKKKAEKRLALLNSDPLVLIHFANVSISLLIDIYSSSVDLTVRRSVLGTILKIFDALTPTSLKSVVENLEISLLLSSIFSRRDNPSLVVGALEIGHILLQKLPEIYVPAFFRGGIIHDVKSILRTEEDKAKATDKSTVRAEPENENEQENDEDEEDEDEDEDSEEDHDHSSEDSRHSDEENESSLSHLTKFYFFDSNLSPVIIYDAKTFVTCYESNLQTSEFEAMQKEREELEFLSEKIRSDKSNLKEHYASFAEKLNKVSEFELLSSHILRSVLESLTSDGSNDMKNTTLDFLSGFYQNGSPRTFELLIERLTELLARFEKFDVISADISGSQSSPASLARQLRINLVPEDNKKKAKPITISIQAIATFNTVEEFFKQKLDLDIFNTGSKFFDRLSSSLYESEEEEEEQEEELQEGEQKEAAEGSGNADLKSEWHLEFYLDGELMPKDSTIYGSIYRYLQAKEEAKLKPGETLSKNFALGIWSTPYQITFKKVNGPKPEVKETPVEAEAINPCFEVPSSFGDNESISVVVRLLSVLFNINSSIPELVGLDHTIRPLAISKFLSSKLSAKLNRQLEEPLVVVGGILPDWTVDATRLYPFLFPFETRYSFLQSTSFGYSRLIFKWLNNNNNSRREQNSSRSMGRLMRQKVRVSRNHLLQSAIKVLDLYGASPYVLEVEFFDDVGTGSGPTLEFYASVSKQFTRKKLTIWRNEDVDPKNQFVFTKQGLYPLPYSPEFFDTKAGVKVLGFFKSLGIFIARAMLDSRIIDINFNPVFFRHSLSSSVGGNSIGTVSLVDKQLGQSLSMLQKFVEQKKQGVVNPEVDGAHLEDLALDFTYPGQSNLLLKEDGANVNVTLDNVDSYIDCVVDMTIGFGVETQINAFREGFSQVFPYAALHAFNPEELVVMCGQGENDWSYELLCSAAKADHGYSLDSRIVRELFEVMSTFTKAEQKQFLQFVTGSPNLPIGGFKALSPPFTIVCRESEMPLTPDDYLPTVMTCVNYFKLPNYSSKEVLKERLKTAIREGSGSFLLS